MTNTNVADGLSVADLQRARTYAAKIYGWDDDGSEWIRILADEVERLQRELRASEDREQQLMAEVAEAMAEATTSRVALRQLYDQVATMIKELP